MDVDYLTNNVRYQSTHFGGSSDYRISFFDYHIVTIRSLDNINSNRTRSKFIGPAIWIRHFSLTFLNAIAAEMPLQALYCNGAVGYYEVSVESDWQNEGYLNFGLSFQ